MNNASINLRLPEEMKKYLDGIARETMVSTADVVRACLLERMPDKVKAKLIGGGK